MEIRDRWVVREVRDNLYFTGMNPENYPVLESLNSRVRQYKSKRSAECAVRRIEESGIECCEFVAEYIKLENVPDVPADKPVTAVPSDQQKEPPIIKNDGGWETVDSFGKKGQVHSRFSARTVSCAASASTRREHGHGTATTDGI